MSAAAAAGGDDRFGKARHVTDGDGALDAGEAEDCGAGEEGEEGANEEGDGSARQARAPWHFKVLLLGTVGYLGWRAYQGVSWLAHHIH